MEAQTLITLVVEDTDRMVPFHESLTKGCQALRVSMDRYPPDEPYKVLVLNFKNDCIVPGIELLFSTILAQDVSCFDRRLAIFVVGQQDPKRLKEYEQRNKEYLSSFRNFKMRSLVISRNPNVTGIANQFGLDGNNHLYFDTPQELEDQFHALGNIVERYRASAWFNADKALTVLSSELMRFRPSLEKQKEQVINLDI
jgi:hypothetical protein